MVAGLAESSAYNCSQKERPEITLEKRSCQQYCRTEQMYQQDPSSWRSAGFCAITACEGQSPLAFLLMVLCLRSV